MGVVDTLFVLNRFFFIGVAQLFHSEDHHDATFKITWPIMIPIRYFLYQCSAYFTVLLSFERYLSVCRPDMCWPCRDFEKLYRSGIWNFTLTEFDNFFQFCNIWLNNNRTSDSLNWLQKLRLPKVCAIFFAIYFKL